MKLAFVSFYEAYPPVSGAASVTFNAAKHCPGRKLLIQMGREKPKTSISADFMVTTLTEPAGRWHKLLGINTVIRKIILNLIGFSPDVIVLEGASWVVYHWLLVRQIKKKQLNVKIIYHAHNVEYVLRKQKHVWPIVMLTKWAEAKLLGAVNLAFAVSDVDISQFQQLYKVRPLLLPNGVDIARFDAVTQADTDAVSSKYGVDGKTILFMGFYYYRPNRDGIDFLVNAVMPKVLERCQNAKLAVIGGDIPYHEEWLITPGIIDHHELPAFVKSCGIGVAPIFSGSGTRLKILECMAAGKPVVSTSKGAEGLNVSHGNNIMLAETSEEFASVVIKLLYDGQLAELIGGCGREFVVERYAWKTLMASFHNVLNKID
jgi:polysaccharide biosynthesis protein PslH